MRTFVCVLLVLGAVSAQPPVDPPTTIDANAFPTETVTTADAAAVPTAASPATATAAANGVPTTRGTVGLNLGEAFYGPGLNNPLATRPNSNTVKVLQNYLRTAPNRANLRVFVDVDGAAHLTDQFGQEIEAADPLVSEFIELGPDPFELQERVLELRQQGLEEAILRCETEARQRYFQNPAAFTPSFLKGVHIPTVGGGPGGAGPRVTVA